MYADPRNIREHEIKVRFSDKEMERLNYLITATGEQRAVLVRRLALCQLDNECGPEPMIAEAPRKAPWLLRKQYA